MWALVDPRDTERVQQLFAEHGARGEPAVEEFRLRIVRPDGDVRWAEVRAALDPAAGLCHIVGRDITERDEADAERLGQAFRDAPTGIAFIGVDGVLPPRQRRARATARHDRGGARRPLRA